MTGTRKRLVQMAIVVAVALPCTVTSSVPSFAAHPSQQDVANAKAKIGEINHQLEGIVEQYDQARAEFQVVQQKLSGAKERMTRAQAAAEAARTELSRRAADAYTGMGSQLDVLLGAQNFSDFSDRLEFMGALAQSDADLATEADTARAEADWARQEYAGALDDAKAKLNTVNARRDQVNGLLSEAEQYYAKTNADYQSFLAAQQAALAAQQQQDNNAGTNPPSAPSNHETYNPPPPDVTGAARAIDAARQVIGTTYVFGSADPSVGFDCSGLTMWAWAQAGVSLPHSSAMQYAVLPHVALSDIQPGDLLFFYTPISHVALYIGGGRMIHARHPGPGGEVQETAISAYDQPIGAARP